MSYLKFDEGVSEEQATQVTRELCLGQHCIAEVGEIENYRGGAEKGGSKCVDCRFEGGCWKYAHVKVEARGKGTSEHQPGCVPDRYVSAGLCHLL